MPYESKGTLVTPAERSFLGVLDQVVGREVVRNLPDEENLINILTNISGKTGQNGSRAGEIEPLKKAAQTALNAASRLELSQSGDSETLVEVAGIEPEIK